MEGDTKINGVEIALPVNDESIKQPVRGSLRLNVFSSSPRVTAGSNFSIFIIIQNPFDIPITIYQAQTHIPIELIDINGVRIRQSQSFKKIWDKLGNLTRLSWSDYIYGFLQGVLQWFGQKQIHTGVAIAVGTEFDPNAEPKEREFASITTKVDTMGPHSSVIGMQFSFPQNPSSDELDRIFRRIIDYRKGLVPVILQPGDSIVKQFVLCTRKWLLFTPLTHQFQIQVNYSSDGVDHADTTTYEQAIQASLGATIVGGIIGALIGSLLKTFSAGGDLSDPLFLFKPMLISTLASIAVVIAFARKAGVQPIVSVEDFWGGLLIGFSIGFFGFEQFSNLFSSGSSK